MVEHGKLVELAADPKMTYVKAAKILGLGSSKIAKKLFVEAGIDLYAKRIPEVEVVASETVESGQIVDDPRTEVVGRIERLEAENQWLKHSLEILVKELAYQKSWLWNHHHSTIPLCVSFAETKDMINRNKTDFASEFRGLVERIGLSEGWE